MYSEESYALPVEQPNLFPDMVYLRHIDAARNMRRYYRLYILCDLFGRWILVREWGRVGSRGGAVRREEYESFGPALDALSLWVKAKKRRGYVEV